MVEGIESLGIENVLEVWKNQGFIVSQRSYAKGVAIDKRFTQIAGSSYNST